MASHSAMLETAPASERRTVNFSAVRGIMLERKQEIEKTREAKDKAPRKAAGDLVAEMAKKNEAVRRKFELAQQDKLAAERNNASVVSSVAKPSPTKSVEVERPVQDVATLSPGQSFAGSDCIVSHSTCSVESTQCITPQSSPAKDVEVTVQQNVSPPKRMTPGRGKRTSPGARGQCTQVAGRGRALPSVARVIKPGGIAGSARAVHHDQAKEESLTPPAGTLSCDGRGGAANKGEPCDVEANGKQEEAVARHHESVAEKKQKPRAEKTEAERRREALQNRMASLFGEVMEKNSQVKKTESTDNSALFSGTLTVTY